MQCGCYCTNSSNTSPGGDRLLSCSPSLLTEQNFQKVEAALVQLHARLPESSVASLVQRQTLYLTEDLEYLLAEVKRCGPDVTLLDLLLCAQQYNLADCLLGLMQVYDDCSRLSVCRLFGMPDDDAALRVIEHNPDVIMEVTSNRHLSLW